jgi:hypothetical protein
VSNPFLHPTQVEPCRAVSVALVIADATIILEVRGSFISQPIEGVIRFMKCQFPAPYATIILEVRALQILTFTVELGIRR